MSVAGTSLTILCSHGDRIKIIRWWFFSLGHIRLPKRACRPRSGQYSRKSDTRRSRGFASQGWSLCEFVLLKTSAHDVQLLTRDIVRRLVRLPRGQGRVPRRSRIWQAALFVLHAARVQNPSSVYCIARGHPRCLPGSVRVECRRQGVPRQMRLCHPVWRVSSRSRRGIVVCINTYRHTPWAGAANLESGVTIDLKNLQQITVSPDRTTAEIGPGNQWGDVYKTLEEFGLATAGGRVSPVGVGGLLTGAGFSFFAPRTGYPISLHPVATNTELESTGLAVIASSTSRLSSLPVRSCTRTRRRTRIS